MRFSDYVALKEDFNSTDSKIDSGKGFSNQEDLSKGGLASGNDEPAFGDNPAAAPKECGKGFSNQAELKESDEYGIDKIDLSDLEDDDICDGFEFASNVANQFANASDGQNTDVELYLDKAYNKASSNLCNMSDEQCESIKEACEYILSVLESSENEELADDENDFGDFDDMFSDSHDSETTVPHISEDDFFDDIDIDD